MSLIKFTESPVTCFCKWNLLCKPARLNPTAGFCWSTAAGFGVRCICLEITVHLLHRSRWLSLQVENLRCARRAVYHFSWRRLWIVHLLFCLTLDVWLSVIQGLHQGFADTMGSSQMCYLHKYSSKLKSFLPRLWEIGDSASPAAVQVSHSPLCREITDIIRFPGMYH